MASAATTLRISITLGNSSSDRIFAGQPISRTNVVLPRHSSSSSGRSSSVLTFWRRRTNKANSPLTSSNKKKKSIPRKDIEEDEEEDEDEDEDAFEKLFQLLEEDLKNDDLSFDDNDEISEEDLATFERELAEALKDDELRGELDSIADEENENDDEDEEVVAEDDDIGEKDEEIPVKLKNWQLKRLAYAMKTGRRKTHIKSLAADLCLDRAVVLELLRNPPPSLLLLSAALPDEPKPRMIGPETKTQDIDPVERSDVTIPEANVEEPIHVMQSRWSAQKRVKKVQLETLERVYRRSKRPTNAMISSLVNVTNLPRRRVLQWFEERRSEEGVPDRRIPYKPSV